MCFIECEAGSVLVRILAQYVLDVWSPVFLNLAKMSALLDAPQQFDIDWYTSSCSAGWVLCLIAAIVPAVPPTICVRDSVYVA